MRPHERVKPQVQTARQISNDTTAHDRGDATVSVWQVHVSQCESEHAWDFLSVMPNQQLQSCVVSSIRKISIFSGSLVFFFFNKNTLLSFKQKKKTNVDENVKKFSDDE